MSGIITVTYCSSQKVRVVPQNSDFPFINLHITTKALEPSGLPSYFRLQIFEIFEIQNLNYATFLNAHIRLKKSHCAHFVQLTYRPQIYISYSTCRSAPLFYIAFCTAPNAFVFRQSHLVISMGIVHPASHKPYSRSVSQSSYCVLLGRHCGGRIKAI